MTSFDVLSLQHLHSLFAQGGEKKRNEILQLAVLEVRLAAKANCWQQDLRHTLLADILYSLLHVEL